MTTQINRLGHVKKHNMTQINTLGHDKTKTHDRTNQWASAC